MLTVSPDAFNNILVVPLRFIGDTILTVPLVRNIRHHFPNAKITVLVSKTTQSLLEPCPYIDDVWVEPKRKSDLLQQLKAKKFDSAFVLRKSVTFAALTKLAGIPLVVGYDKQRFFQPLHYKRWGWFLDTKARYPSLRTETHQAEHHLSLLNAIGLEPKDNNLELWTTDEDEKTVSQLLTRDSLENKKLAVIHATSASHGKMLRIEKYVLSVQKLAEAGFHIIATGIDSDKPLYDSLAELSGVEIYNWAGETSLRQTVALYKKIDTILTVDSSPLHMAAAVGVPNITAVFGPTNEKQWGVLNSAIDFRPVFKELSCRPCYAKVCSHNNCRETMMAEDIANSL